MYCKNGFYTFLCRGRKKKIMILVIILIFLLNAMILVSLELFNTIRNKNKLSKWHEKLKFGTNSYTDSKGMRVIVGHYVGVGTARNLTQEVINRNGYAPVPGAGEGGRPVQLSPREVITANELYSLHSYNILVGDRISVNRSLPDMRSESCRDAHTYANLTTASVVIVFHNEAWSTLLRTVMSVLNRSPERLLSEIILVDDASDRAYLAGELESAVAPLRRVRLVRSAVRAGLVAARLRGAARARGHVLVFLDAHCEVTTGWLEPLIHRASTADVFICPHIDIISDDTLAYHKSSDAHSGAFNWRLQFRWIRPSKAIVAQKTRSPAEPYPIPAMAGGLFAVRRSLFWTLGSYDEGMHVWGGENLELSWRAWQCGARVEITSCSRVGHIFRKHSPYKFPGGVGKVLNTNLARAAAVWMDEWAEFVFKFNPAVGAIRDQQAVGERVELRGRLKCKSFKWYLENVWPEHFFPTDDRWFGRIKNAEGGCLGTVVGTSPGLGGPAVGVACGTDADLERLLIFTPQGRVMGDEGLCLATSKTKVLWESCSDGTRQIWHQKGPRLKDNLYGLCLTLKRESGELGISGPLLLIECEGNRRDQLWNFERVPWR